MVRSYPTERSLSMRVLRSYYSEIVIREYEIQRYEHISRSRMLRGVGSLDSPRLHLGSCRMELGHSRRRRSRSRMVGLRCSHIYLVQYLVIIHSLSMFLVSGRSRISDSLSSPEIHSPSLIPRLETISYSLSEIAIAILQQHHSLVLYNIIVIHEN